MQKLLQHIAAMADDAYLAGHPEWAEIVKEASELEPRLTKAKSVERGRYIHALERLVSAAREMTEAWELYHAPVSSYPPYLPSLPDFARDLRNWLESETIDGPAIATPATRKYRKCLAYAFGTSINATKLGRPEGCYYISREVEAPTGDDPWWSYEGIWPGTERYASINPEDPELLKAFEAIDAPISPYSWKRGEVMF